MEKLQKWLRERCEESSLTWREASIKSNLNPGAISAIMSGQVPGLETCKKLAKFFRISVVDVLNWAGHIERLPANSPLFYDSLFADFADCWLYIDPEDRKALLHFARKMAAKKGRKNDE